MGRDAITDMKGFEMGKPVLVCRWRLYNRRLPLENRHMRALLARTVSGEPVATELVAWAKQHIEWTLEQGSAEHPNGVLMLIVDQNGRAAMTVGPFTPLEDTSLTALLHRAERAATEARQTGVAPETIWVAQGDSLLWDPVVGPAASGSSSLIVQLAQTLGLDVRKRDGLADAVANKTIHYTEAFLVSDEHGVVPAIDAMGPHGRRLAQGYVKLLERR